jgi:hypothetical protein
MKVVAGGLCVLCLLAAGARADEPRRLILDPPRLLLGTTDPATPNATRADPDDPDGLSQAQIGWLAFGADALLELGASATETGLLGFGAALLASDNGAGTVSLLVLGLLLVIHPAFDAFLVDAIARVSHRTQPSFLATLIGSYIGCLLGVGGFALAFVALEAEPVLELVVASLLNALIPAATTVLAEVLTQQKLPDGQRATGGTPGSAVAQRDPPSEANQAAWKTGLADPLARWTF